MIYICIPARDEEQTIGVLLWKVRSVLTEAQRDFQILLFEDGSSDHTADVVDRYRHVLPIRVLRSEEGVGYAAALERLLREAVQLSAYPKRDVAVTLQADFTDDPEDIVRLVKTIEGGADLVAGTATTNGRPFPRGVRWTRRLAPRLMGRAWSEAPVSDPLSGFRAYRVVVLQKALEARNGVPLLRLRGMGANVELLARTATHARRIEEEPSEPRYQIRQRPSRLRALRTLSELYRMRGSRVWEVEEGR